MPYIYIHDCWFNLQLVESIEFSRTVPDDGRALHTVVISLASGRTWCKRDLTPAQLDDCKAQIAAAVRPAPESA